MLADAEAQTARLEGELKESKKVEARLREVDIPELMDELELESFTTKSGFRLEVGEQMFGKQLTEAHQAALKWLRSIGEGGMIQTVVDIPFAHGSEADADELLERLAGEGFAAFKGVMVNAGTLKAAVKRMLEAGKPVPLDVLGIHTKRVAKVSR